ncbi:MAG: alginate export family protein, partial [Rhodanobacteraceae bacterium]
FFSCAIHAADSPAAGLGKSSRYDDNFRALCAAKPRDRYASIKCLKPAPRVQLALGGDLRLREEVGDPTKLAGGKPIRDSYLLERALLDADLRFGDNARVFVQLGYHLVQYRAGAAKSTDNDRTDLQQGFVDFGGNIGDGRLTERFGRQEVSFGASRLMSVRERSNIRRAFDATNTIWTGDEWNVRALFGHPVLPRPGAFDDIADHSQALWGVYASSKRHDLDVYYLGYLNRNAKFAGVPGEERRQTLGVRAGTKAHGWDGEVEAVGQFGSFAGRDIHAFGVYTVGGYTWKDVPWQPRIGLRADALSGDRHPGNSSVGTFNPLFGSSSYFTQAGYNTAANLYDLYPSLRVSPTAKLSFELGYDDLWRYSTRDAFYQSPLTVVFAGNASSARHIGTQSQLSGNWRPNSYLQFNMALVHFTPGAFALAAGGRSANFTMGSVALRF